MPFNIKHNNIQDHLAARAIPAQGDDRSSAVEAGGSEWERRQ